MIRRALPLLLLLVSTPALAAGNHLVVGGENFVESDILDARAQPELDGTSSIRITFNDAAAKRIALVTARLVGKPALVSLDDKAVADPVLHEPIRDGVLQLSGAWLLADAEALAKKISGKDPLPDSLEE